VVGKTITVNQRKLTIIGVAPPEFRGSVPGLSFGLWIPMAMAPEINGQGNWLLEQRTEKQMWVTVRLKPGVGIGQVRQEAIACQRQIFRTDPQEGVGFSADVVPIWKGSTGAQHSLRQPLVVLMAVCLALFLIVVANVANLQLARATARLKEVSIRMAMGASPWRLTRQLLTESVALAGAGGVAGVLMSLWAGQSLVWLFPVTGLPLQLEFALNRYVLGFTFLLCVVVAVAAGLAPAIHAARASLVENLKDGSRGTTGGAGMHRMRGLLVVSEVALALVALVGAGLFASSFHNAQAIHPGLDARNVVFSQLYVETFCRTREQREQFCRRLKDRLHSLPGVASVSYAGAIPLDLGSGAPGTEVDPQGYGKRKDEDMRVRYSNVAPDYFDALRIPLLDGRDFTERDDAKAARVMIVNQTFARRFFGGGNPLGRKCKVYGAWSTVVGLAQDSKYGSVTEAAQPFFYLPWRQWGGGEFWMAFFVRTRGPAAAAIPAVRREAVALEPGAGASQFIPFEEFLGVTLYPLKVAAALLTVLGAVALLLAGVGLYSVLAFSVSQRKQEFGIRMALGASPWDVLGMVVRQGMKLTLAGLAVGMAAALGAARFASGLLVGVSPADPLVFAGAALFLGAVAFLASYIPARSATQVDPMIPLRGQ
jgi:predicted permease